LSAEGFPVSQHRFQRTADLRYYGQAFEVRVAVPDGTLDAARGDAVVDAFHDTHRALYGYDFRGDARQPVEWVNLRVSGVGPIRRPQLRKLPDADGDPVRARAGDRPVCFEGTGYLLTARYRRADLAPSDRIAGPAIVEEYGATVPLHPGFIARVDGFGNLLITSSQST
jgi:N-methylhydantoinase A